MSSIDKIKFGEVFNIEDPTKVAKSDITTSWESTPSDAKVPSEKLVKSSFVLSGTTLTITM